MNQMTNDIKTPASKEAERRAVEARYMQGEARPIAGSILISTSKYLNSPNYRDVFAQFSLRKQGRDLPQTYLIPKMSEVIAECWDSDEYVRLFREEKASNAMFSDWVEARHSYDFDPEEMADYPSGTLGAAIRDFIVKSGFDMQFMMKGHVPANDMEYMVKARSHSHDIEHIMTGFGANLLGEIALGVMNSSSNARFFSPGFAKYNNEHTNFASFSAMYRTSLHSPVLMEAIWEAVRLGVEAGQSIKMPLSIVPWHNYLHLGLDEAASELGFTRGPENAWDWAEEIWLNED